MSDHKPITAPTARQVEKAAAAAKQLGPRALARIVSTDNSRTMAKRWLIGLGFDSGEVSTMKLETLVQAYNSPSYLESMWRRRCNDWHMLTARLAAIDSATPSMDTEDDTDDATTAPESLPTVTKPTPIQHIATDLLSGLDPAETAIIEALRAARQPKAVPLDEDRVIALIREHSATPATVRLEINTGLEIKRTEGAMHHAFPALLAAVSAGVNIMLVGPAGSGKTTAAEKACEALDIPFFFTGAVDSPYKLTGFRTATGEVVRTAFREAYEHGGGFLFDEMDASAAGAVLAFNAALANGHADFPDGMIKRHPKFRAIAATNTFGRGADRQYVGRTQQDAAALDRYATLAWDYDPALEAAMIGLPRPEGAPQPVQINPIKDEKAQGATAAAWLATVQTYRRRIEEQKIRHIVSPRATIMGVQLLCAGWPRDLVTEALIFKGMDSDTRAKLN